MVAVVIAAGLDWLEGLLPLLFVGFWIVSQIMALFRRGRGNVVIEGRPAQKPPVVVLRPARPEVDRSDLERQVEEFLRSRGAAAARPAVAPPPAERRRPAPETRVEKPREESRPPSLRPTEPRETGVAKHVHDVFGHELAHLETTLSHGGLEQPVKQTASVAAAEIAALVRDPRTIRQMILLREVLERPTDRW